VGQPEVDLVTRTFEGFARDGGFATVWDQLDPDLEWETSPNLPDAGVYRGRERVRQFMEEQWDVVWGGAPQVDVERAFDCGDRVLVFLRVRGRGSHTQIPLDVRIAQLATVRNGRIAAVKVFPDREEALAAVGIAEP
jgi:ketosteroid isomerase-like protein